MKKIFCMHLEDSVETHVLMAALVFALLALPGCVSDSGENMNTTAYRPVDDAEISNDGGGANETGLLTASGGFGLARGSVVWLHPDASLVEIQGEADREGFSDKWEYVFVSDSAKKSYYISIPGGNESRKEMPFVFSKPLEGWIDSGKAASTCGIGGSMSIQVSEGAPQWTVLGESVLCIVNASDGSLVEKFDLVN